MEDEEKLRKGGIGESASMLPLTQRSMKAFQEEDLECKSIRSLLQEGDKENVYANLSRGGRRQKYFMKDGVIWAELADGEPKLFVPKKLRKHIMHVLHRSKVYCHPGIERMLATLKESLWWPNMKRDVTDMVRGCFACLRSKVTQPKGDGKAISVVPSKPFAVVGADVIGPFPKSSKHDYRYIIIFVDHYSRWIRLVPVANVTAEEVADAMLKSWIKDFGTPELLVTDQGSVFTADVITCLTALMGFKIHAFPAESQWRNGRVERVGRYLKERLRVWKKGDFRPWPELLPFVEMSHHFMTMPQYGMSPYEILYGRKAQNFFTKQEWEHGVVPTHSRMWIASMHGRLKRVRAKYLEIERSLIAKRLKRINKSRLKVEYKPGQQVMYFTKGTKDKLTYLWSDAAVVVKKLDDCTYRVKTPSDKLLDISTQRMKGIALVGREKEEVIGPFAENYPSLVMEGTARGTVPEQNLQLLDKEVLPSRKQRKPASYDYVNDEGEVIDKPASPWLLTYGEHVAYETPSGGWKIGQYLGDHPDVPEGSLKLRRMNVLSSKTLMENPRRAIWRYEWDAQRGKNVVAELGYPPDRRPSAKNTGSLKQAWDVVEHDKIYCAVTMTSGRISSASYRELIHHIMPERIADVNLVYVHV